MRLRRLFGFSFSTIVTMLVLGSCAQKMVCPAYQSAFIFDEEALKKKFSYFVNDTPKIYEVSKNKFLLIEPVSYRKKLASFRTIEMLPIYPVIPDSLKFTGDDQMKLDTDVRDSTGAAPVKPLHPGLIGPKFNVEQENYMYYFRKILVLPDVRAEKATVAKKKKKFFGFLDKIFKKDKSGDGSGETAEKRNFFQRVFNKNSGAQAESGEAPAEKQSFFQRVFNKDQKEVAADGSPPAEKKSFLERLGLKKKSKTPEEEEKKETKKADNEGF